MQSEDRNFTVHPHILFSIIQSQAGTLGKALLEGVMNSIDAGATKLSVTLTEEGFTLRDDGRGFQSRDEILNWFEQFGTPHTEGDAIYGKFRMGRGQMMAFAINTWRTGTFRMDVDIKGRGLDYKLTDKLAPVKGCRVEGKLYQPLSRSDLDSVITEFTDLVRYAQIPVSLNGRVISKQPKVQSWDAETDDAYLNVSRTGDLYVYNLGVLVRKYPAYEFGCGGTVVSKLPLAVNFARNDVLIHSCEVWRRIVKYLKRTNLVKVTNKPSLNDEERKFLAKQWAYGDIPAGLGLQMEDLKLFTDAAGKHHSLRDLASRSRITVANEKQARTGARLHREQVAFVLAEETLERFRVSSVQELIETVNGHEDVHLSIEPVSFEEVALGCEETYQVHDASELPLAEQCVLKALQDRHDKFYQWFSSREKNSGIRELKAGSSDVAQAWTDGRSYVVISRKELARAAKKGLPAFFEIIMTLVHEYCHDSADSESHSHDQVFLTKHHDLVQYYSGKLVALAQDLTKHYQRLARKAGIELPEKEKPLASAAAPTFTKVSAAAEQRALMAKAQLPLFD